MPTLVFFKDGKVLDSLVGLASQRHAQNAIGVAGEVERRCRSPLNTYFAFAFVPPANRHWPAGRQNRRACLRGGRAVESENEQGVNFPVVDTARVQVSSTTKGKLCCSN